MRYIIDYAVRCEKGLVRGKNQDNFWCAGKYLVSENSGLDLPLTGSGENTGSPVFAVFDGMGGEKFGEVAAYLAAGAFDVYHANRTGSSTKQFLSGACERMNEEICSYAMSNHTGYMGTTAAILAFDRKQVYVCNIGDSRIFQHSGGKLTQITHDHVATVSTDRKPALSQNLGIPSTEFIIEPYIAKGDYADGDRYLICSDGLTDMVTHDEIEKTLSEVHIISVCVDALIDSALSNGGVDNITVILCDVHKKGSFSILERTGVKK